MTLRYDSSLQHKGQVFVAQNGLELRLNPDVIQTEWDEESPAFNFMVISMFETFFRGKFHGRLGETEACVCVDFSF